MLSKATVGMSLFGLQKMPSRHREVKALLRILGDRIYIDPSARPFPKEGDEEVHLTAQQISNATYGLQNMNSDDEAVQHVVGQLARRCAESPSMLDPQGISNAVFGLQHCDGSTREVQQLLQMITAKMKPEAVLTSQGIGNTMLGLKRMDCDDGSLREFLAALAPIVHQSQETLNGQEFASALYGLQSMRSDVPEVAAVLAALPRLVTDRASLSCQGAGMALYGLQNMQSSTPEVRAILELLAPRIAACEEAFRSQVVGMCGYGLKSLIDDGPEVRAVVEAAAAQFDSLPRGTPLEGRHLGNALYGLQSMHRKGVSKEVSGLLGVLRRRAQAGELADMGQLHVGMALYGIHGLGDHVLEELLLSKLQADQPLFGDQEWLGDPKKGAESVVTSLVQTLHLMGRPIPPWLQKQVDALQVAAHDMRWQGRMGDLLQGALEQRVWEELQEWCKASGKPETHVTPGFIIDGFSIDFFFEGLGLALEVDGKHHLYPTQRLLDERRDEFLFKKHGIRTVRIATKRVDRYVSEWVPQEGLEGIEAAPDVFGELGAVLTLLDAMGEDALPWFNPKLV
jgi:very-short-patch-repair endonuclease